MNDVSPPAYGEAERMRADDRAEDLSRGVTCWVDIEAADVEVTARFYGALFGWTFIDSPLGSQSGYLIAQLDGQDSAGIGQPSVTNGSAAPPRPGTPTSPSWTSTRPLPA